MQILRNPSFRKILDHPALFNGVRWLLAGDQGITHRLIKEELFLIPGDKILDVCCGTGDFARSIEGQYLGIDLNERFIQFASNRYSGDDTKEFLVMDALNTGFEGRSFDKTLFISGLHHFSDSLSERILKEMARVTLNSAIIVDLLADVPNPIKRTLANLDRGDFVRPINEKVRLIEQSFDIVKKRRFCSRLAEQVMFVCIPKSV